MTGGTRPAPPRITGSSDPMTLKQLRFFLGVLRAGSFTRAALSLHVAQPAIGVQIAALENALGVDLLIRHSRGVTPTEAGEVLAEHAARIVGKVERMRLDIMDMGGEPRGRIVLGLTGTALRIFHARLAETCRRDYPAVALAVTEAASHRLAGWLAQGRLDMAVTCGPPANAGAASEAPLAEAPAEAPSEVLATAPLCLVARPGHALADGPGIPLRAALDADLVLPPRPSWVRRRIEVAARANGAELRSVRDAESVTAMIELARLGLACAVLPHGAVAQEVAAGSLAALPIVDPPLTATFYLACSERRAGTRALEAVRSEIRALVTGSAGGGAAVG